MSQTKFEEICNPRANITMERHKFNSRYQQTGESFQTYLSDLRNKAKSCQFNDLHDDLLRDRLVSGISDDSLRKLLLREPKLTLQKAIDICQIHELTEKHTKTLAGQNDPAVDSLYAKSNAAASPNAQTQSTRHAPNAQNQITGCKNCGGNHEAKREKCFAYGKQCNKCGKLNHFGKKCRGHLPRVNAIDTTEESMMPDSFVIDSVNNRSSSKREIHTSVIINGTRVEFKVDMGPNVMSSHTRCFAISNRKRPSTNLRVQC